MHMPTGKRRMWKSGKREKWCRSSQIIKPQSTVFAVTNPGCLQWDVEQNKNSFGTLCTRKRILRPEHNKEKKSLIAVLSLVQTSKH